MVAKYGLPQRIGDGLLFHLAETDTDMPAAGVDVVVRNLRVRNHPPMERLGVLVCPNESGLYIAKTDGVPVIKKGKTIPIRCQDCRICIDRGLAGWEKVKHRYAGVPKALPDCAATPAA
jgi:hypothetical protein